MLVIWAQLVKCMEDNTKLKLCALGYHVSLLTQLFIALISQTSLLPASSVVVALLN